MQRCCGEQEEKLKYGTNNGRIGICKRMKKLSSYGEQCEYKQKVFGSSDIRSSHMKGEQEKHSERMKK